MYEYELIQSRNISGKGVLKIPSDVVENRAYILYCSVFRLPKQEYKNLNYNPYRSRYGQLVFLRDDYVTNMAAIEFKNQVFDGVNDISGQVLIAVKCAYDGILESIFRLSTNLAATPGSFGLTPVTYTNLIADYTSLRLSWNECRLICYADTAINLSLYRLKYDACNADFDKSIAPPIPEDIPQSIPAGEPLTDLSPSYEGTNDNGNSVPFLGDTLFQPAPKICTLTFNSYRSDVPNFVGDNSFIVPNDTYNNAYVDIVSTSGSTYTYYARSSGSAGVVTLAGPFSPLSTTTITYNNFEVTCV